MKLKDYITIFDIEDWYDFIKDYEDLIKEPVSLWINDTIILNDVFISIKKDNMVMIIYSEENKEIGTIYRIDNMKIYFGKNREYITNIDIEVYN